MTPDRTGVNDGTGGDPSPLTKSPYEPIPSSPIGDAERRLREFAERLRTDGEASYPSGLIEDDLVHLLGRLETAERENKRLAVQVADVEHHRDEWIQAFERTQLARDKAVALIRDTAIPALEPWAKVANPKTDEPGASSILDDMMRDGGTDELTLGSHVGTRQDGCILDADDFRRASQAHAKLSEEIGG